LLHKRLNLGNLGSLPQSNPIGDCKNLRRKVVIRRRIHLFPSCFGGWCLGHCLSGQKSVRHHRWQNEPINRQHVGKGSPCHLHRRWKENPLLLLSPPLRHVLSPPPNGLFASPVNVL